MNISISLDPEDKQILSLYVKVRDGEVFRTVEIAEGECYADEDKNGNLLGVEMLAPGHLKLGLKLLSSKYHDQGEGIEEVIRKASLAMA